MNVKVIVDDNNVTISGHPQQYMPGYDIAKTLSGHGLSVEIVDGEDIDKLYAAMATAFTIKGPYAVVVRRPGASIDGEGLGAFVGARLAGFKRPRRFEFVPILPRNAANKVQIGILREQFK